MATPDYHWVRIDDNTLSLILDYDPDEASPEARPETLLAMYRRWRNTVVDAIEDGLETA